MKFWQFATFLFALFLCIGVKASNHWSDPPHQEVRRTVLEREETFRPGVIKEDLLVLDSIFVNNMVSEVVTSRIKKERFVVVDSVAVGQRMLFNNQGELFLMEHFRNGKLERVDCLYPRHQNLIPNGSFEQVEDINEHLINTDSKIFSSWANDFEHDRTVELDEIRVEGKDTIRFERVTDLYFSETPKCERTLEIESFFVYRNSKLVDSIFSRVISYRLRGGCFLVPHNCNYSDLGMDVANWNSLGKLSPKILNWPRKTPHHPLEGFISHHRNFKTVCGNNFAQITSKFCDNPHCIVLASNPLIISRLATTLPKGRHYKLSFWVWKPRVYEPASQLTVGFWKNEPDESIASFSENSLVVSDFHNPVIGEWYKVDLQFVAADFFRYLTVGFHQNESTKDPSYQTVTSYLDSFVLVPEDIVDQDVDKLFYPDIILAAHHDETNLLAGDGEDKTEQPVSPAGVEPQIDLEGEKKVTEISEFSFGPILFETNSADLNFEAFQILDSLAQFLKENSHWELQITGHTDNAGTPVHNLDLSTRRAGNVADYLIGKGIEETRLNIKGLGSTGPVDTNETPEGMQKNRRVELRLYVD
ncbi:MAG: OmpA family protein [Bacteroidales bacterium]|nr:OmpA family protein [Bacteroidales bacterium]